jgi:hypothetical protein
MLSRPPLGVTKHGAQRGPRKHGTPDTAYAMPTSFLTLAYQLLNMPVLTL